MLDDNMLYCGSFLWTAVYKIVDFSNSLPTILTYLCNTVENITANFAMTYDIFRL